MNQAKSMLGGSIDKSKKKNVQDEFPGPDHY